MKYCGESKVIKISAKLLNSELNIAVTDLGIGISKEEMKHIFNPFQRGKIAVSEQIRGNGLGLNIAKNIVKAHGGRLHVESVQGEGSTFIISLKI